MDAAHPQHNPVLGYGWIKCGEDREVRSNTARRRLNIYGPIDLETLERVVRYDDTIEAVSTIALFNQLQVVYVASAWVCLIWDFAKDYRSKLVQEYSRTFRIKHLFLAPMR